jgi:hypothetical protein
MERKEIPQVRIPEGSTESDFNRRRLAAGRLGELELYVSWVWGDWRYLYIIGAHRGVSAVSVWLRRTNWLARRGR